LIVKQQNPLKFFFTMATTKLSNELFVSPCEASLSSWQKIKQSMVGFLRHFVCGCYSAEELALFEEDVRFRSSVRRHMITQKATNASDENALDHAMLQAVEEDEYVLGNFELICKVNEGVTRTEKEWDTYFARLGVDPKTHRSTGMKRSRLIPRFAAACVFALRAKSGLGRARNADNLLTVTRAYRVICKKHGVHPDDADRHCQIVLNAYFTEDITNRLGNVRRQAPKWLKWLYDDNSVSATTEFHC